LEEHDNYERPELLLGDIRNGKISRETVSKRLDVILHSVAQHFEEFKDYNSTTTQSDNGSNLHMLLDFLRQKAVYERYAWRMRPLAQTHEALCRFRRERTAQSWREEIRESTRKLSQYGIKLRTIRDRLEERFLQPYELDRLCASVGPALRELRANNLPGPEFRRFLDLLRPFTDRPTGVGLDAPQWLRRLEEHVQKLLEEERRPPLPKPTARALKRSEILEQVEDWERGIE
jgi:hypothetical protein